MRRAGFALLAATTAMAQPAVVRYQGYLTDTADAPIDDTVDLSFAIYDEDTAGTQVWSQDVTNVPVDGGQFVVDLALDRPNLVADDLWLGVAVNAGAELLPRQRVASALFALVCGDAGAMAGTAASGWQRGVTGICGVAEWIRAVNPDGSVVCEPGDGGRQPVDSLTAGAGLIQDVTVGDVTLSMPVADGLGVDVSNALVAIFSGSGSVDTAARSDHDHIGTYTPVGSSTICGPLLKVVALDPLTGDVTCAADQDTLYGVVASGNLVMTPFNELDLANDVSLLGPMTAGVFLFNGTVGGSVSLHASDFHPTDAEPTVEPFYSASEDQPGQFWFPMGGGGSYCMNLLAPLRLPHGVNITELVTTFDQEIGCDNLICTLYQTSLTDGFVVSVAQAFSFFTGGSLAEATSGALLSPVNDESYSYTVGCDLCEVAAQFPSTFLYGVTVRYEYQELR